MEAATTIAITEPVSITRILDFTQSDQIKAGDSLGPINNLFYANKEHKQLYDWLDKNFDAVFIGVGLGGWLNWDYLWPIFLIAVGVNALIAGIKNR